jgi:hypothetical protein
MHHVRINRDYWTRLAPGYAERASATLPARMRFRLLRANNFEGLDLVELRAAVNAAPNRYKLGTPEWARRWPVEEIWKARKRG